MKKKHLLQMILATTVSLTTHSCNGQKENLSDNHYINDNWELFSANSIQADGEIISKNNFNAGDSYSIQLPATVLSGLRQNGLYPDIFHNMALKRIDQSQFQSPWWYRKTFQITNTGKKLFHHLILEGLNYQGVLWINGQKVADQERLEGAFGIYKLDITPYVREGENTLAIKIYPPKKGDLTLGFVDWNPEAPDKNMGLWRGVKLRTTGHISLDHANVRSDVNTETLDEADLTVSVFATNHSDSRKKTLITANLQNTILTKSITLQPGEKKEVFFKTNDFPELKIKNPELWWPNNLGDQVLHNLTISVSSGNKVLDATSIRYGIREIEDFWTNEGHRGFKVNGEKVLIKGGGWVDDMLLADTDEKVKAQIDYVKHMNLNTIRLEGFWGNNNTLYEYCDQQGIMLMIGWSCQWEWENYCGRPEGEYMSIYPEEYQREATAYRNQVLRARSHPSMLLWTYGSDRLPHPDLEKILNQHMEEIAPDAPIVTTCRGVEVGGHKNTSDISGPSGVKMLGPYAWVSPNYWYTDSMYGGAYGFNTETGPGPQVPPIESLKKMLPRDHWWPIDSMWEYHCGRHEFGSLDRFLNSFNQRYGEANSLEEFTFKNQISSYEAIRGMFEAFAVNKYEATGVIQWMLNSAWPEMYWQLYDYYLRPNGAFYGTRKACSPLSPIYNYKDKNIYVNNVFLEKQENLTLQVKVLNSRSQVVFSSLRDFNIEANNAELILEMPRLKNLTTTYFLDLRIKNKQENDLARNFYWLSTEEDTHNFEETTWVYTPPSGLADLKGINQLEKAKVDLNVKKEILDQQIVFHCTLKNKDEHLAFFNELKIRDKLTQDPILPVFWNENYISLLPGETRTITGRINSKNIVPENAEVILKGFNLK